MIIGDIVKVLRYGRAPRETLGKIGRVVEVYREDGETFASVEFTDGDIFSYNIVKLKLMNESSEQKITYSSDIIPLFLTQEAVNELEITNRNITFFL